MNDQSLLQYDAIVIGTGQAGPPLAGKLTKAGLTTAIIERKRFGGTCVNTGCTPTKALLASASVAHMARRSSQFGVAINGDVTVDMERVKARKDEIVRPKSEGVESWLRGMSGCTVHVGHAHFAGTHEVRVGDKTLRGDKIFINVGARAVIPDIPGIQSVPYLTDSSMMDIERLPGHLLVLGGGYVALEFGQMYRRFGSNVTIVERDHRIAGREDADVSDAIRQILESEGIRIVTDAEAVAVEQDRRGRIDLIVEKKGEKTAISGSHLLVAVGRTPNTDDLGLESAGIETDERGYIKVDDTLATNLPHVWAVGDCNGMGAFTHTSYNDHEIIAANLLDGAERRVSDRIPAYAIYIDPPLGRVGRTEAELRKAGRNALCGKIAMADVARAQEQSETAGFLKVLTDADTKEILGAALLGINCDEVVHVLIDIMAAKAPYTTIRDAVHIHPTVAELVPTLLEDLKPLPRNPL